MAGGFRNWFPGVWGLSGSTGSLFSAEHMEIVAGVESVIKAIGLTQLPAANYYQFKFPWTRGVDHPGCFIIPVRETFESKTNRSYDVGYGVQVTLTQTSNADLQSNMDRILEWREEIIFRFHDRSSLGTTKVYRITAEPGPAIDPQAFKHNYDATSFVLRCMVRKTRT